LRGNVNNFESSPNFDCTDFSFISKTHVLEGCSIEKYIKERKNIFKIKNLVWKELKYK
jgi:hypothetical protein